MFQASYTEYEYRMAAALSSHPELVAFDDMNYFSTTGESSSTSAWDTGQIFPVTAIEEVDDYNDTTVRVDVFNVQLCDPREAALRRRPFKFLPVIRVISTSLTGIMPSADIIMVDAFPITRDVVIDAVRRHLLRTEYAKEKNEFLWGPEVVSIVQE